MHATRTTGLIAVLALGVTACSSSEAEQDSPEQSTPSGATGSSGDREIVVPGERVFPEGVAIDDSTGEIYVGSTEDGTVFKAGLEDSEAEVFLAGGQDGRTAVTGLAVDEERLFVAGRDTGLVFVYDTNTGELIADYDAAGGQRSLINDIAVSDDAAYVTDSFRPVLYRIPIDEGAPGELEEWADVANSAIPFDDEDFNLNGIAITNDGRAVYTVHYASGDLFRIDTNTAAIEPVDLAGESLPEGDGLELEGSTLTAITANGLMTINLDETGLAGTVASQQALDDLRYPTTLALTDEDYVIVNSQLNMSGDDNKPSTPFTLTVRPRP